jgi:hypothetical protein
MPNKNITREQIHTGLSQSKSDEKWSDMMNFRCASNRTKVVPRKFKLSETTDGYHTIIRGVGGLIYAIGLRFSKVLRGMDGTIPQHLWRARVTRETHTDDQSENLRVRGSYLGGVPKSIRVTVVNNRLIADHDWAAPILDEEVEAGEDVTDGAYPLELTISFAVQPWLGTSELERTEYTIGQTVRQNHNIATPEFPTTGDVYQCVKNTAGFPNTFCHAGNVQFWRRLQRYNWVDNDYAPSGVAYQIGERILDSTEQYIFECIQIALLKPPTTSTVIGSSYTKHPQSEQYWKLIGPTGPIPLYCYYAKNFVGDQVSYNGVRYTCVQNHEHGLSPIGHPEISTVPGASTTIPFWSVTNPYLQPARAADVDIYDGVVKVGDQIANANGLSRLHLNTGTYRIVVSRNDCRLTEFTVVKTTALQTQAVTIQQVHTV